MATSRTERKAQTRARILRAANVMFRRQGFETAKTTELAGRVGVSHGTIFAHFDSKASILRELVFQKMRKGLDKLKDTPLQGETAVDKLKSLVRLLWKQVKTDPQLTSAYHSQSWVWSSNEEQEYQKLVTVALEISRQIIQDGIASGEISPEINLDFTLDLLKAKYFDCVRQAQFTRQDNPVDGDNAPNSFPEQFEAIIDYLLEF